MAALAGSGVGIQLQNALSKPLSQRCFDVENIIKTTSTKELRNLFKPLVENIFGFESDTGWMLDKVNKGNAGEFNGLLRLLGPEGPMFGLIHSLQADPYLWYPFPLSALPLPTRRLLEEGTVPTFFSARLQQQQNLGTPVIALSALEFYMCHFAYALVSPSQAGGDSVVWTQMLDFLYPKLALDYLLYFLPFTRRKTETSSLAQQPMGSSISPHRPFLRQRYSSGSPPYGGSGQRYLSSPSTPPRPSLLRSGFTASQKTPVPATSPVLEHSETETWRAEIVLQIFVEFWLNQNSLDIERQYFSHSRFSGRQRSTSEYNPFSYLFVSNDGAPAYLHAECAIEFTLQNLATPPLNYENFLPTLNHVKIVRLLVKYLHYFANSATVIITAPYQSVAQSPLDEFKRTGAAQIVQKKLYAFLRHTFDRWPLDHSFRMVLETWLSYLQPWRYTDHRNLLDPAPVSRSEEGRGVEEKWEGFIQDNLLFYTVLLEEFIPRIHRFDLTSPYSAYMVYRVSKVFSTRHLADYLAKAEEELFGGLMGLPPHLSMTADLGGSYLNMEQLAHLHPPSLPPHLAELETPSFHYRFLFSDRMLAMVMEIIGCIGRALEELAQPMVNTRPVQRGFLGWLASLLDERPDSGHLTPAELSKLTTQLHQITRNLCTIFKEPCSLLQLEVPMWVGQQTPEASAASVTQTLMLEEEDLTPDSIYSDDGPILTAKGRYQIINRQRRFDLHYQGDPELQPIRSWEVAWLVRALFAFCSFINTQYAAEIRELYGRDDLLGRMARVVLSPALSPGQRVSSPLRPHSSQRLRQPRLSLRFLASYRTLASALLLYVLLRLWLGIGVVGFLFLLLLGCLLYVFLAAQFKRNARTADRT